MKTPQRKFVVEFKSGRRQPKARTNSIWGDTDFKALAREVQQQSSHPFHAVEAPTETPDTRPDPLNNLPAGENLIDAKATETPTSETAQQETTIPVAIAPARESQPAAPAAMSENAPRKYSKRKPAAAILSTAIGSANPSLQFETENDLIPEREIAILEAENKRLKRLRAEQLHAENLQLRTMLARFER